MIGKRRTGEEKDAAVDAAARAIIASEADDQIAKTSRLKAARLKQEAQLDEALDESFPVSDPVELGHSEHAGRPKGVWKKARKR